MSVTYPAAKGVLVDQYAQIAMFDAAENQRAIDAYHAEQARRKAEMKAALDEQVRMKQAAAIKERQSRDVG